MTVRFRFRSCLAFIALAGFVGYTFDDLLFGDRVPIYRDLLCFVLPFKHFLGEHLRHGTLPLWNPWIYMGTPFLASLQSGVFYPPSVLLALPFPLGLNLFLFAHYWIALGGTFLWLRRRELTVTAAAVGSLTFVLGGYLVSMLTLSNNLQSAAWTPWILLCWENIEREGGFFPSVSLVLVLACQLLGGAPEIFLMTLFALAARAAFLSGSPTRNFSRLGLALTLVAAITAFQILPTLEYLAESPRFRPLAFDEITYWSLEPVSLLQLLLPHSSALAAQADLNTLGRMIEKQIPWIYSIYLGLVPLCLAIGGLVRGHERRFWGTLIVVAIVLALGKHLPVLPWLVESLPGIFGRFRYPEKFYFLVALGASVMAAEGAEALFRRERTAVRVTAISTIVLLVVGACLFLLGSFDRPRFLELTAILTGEPLSLRAFGPLADDLILKSHRLLLVLGAFLALQYFSGRSILRRPAFCALTVALVGVDLASVHHNANLSMRWSDLAREPLIVDAAELARSHRRIFHYQTMSAAPAGLAAPGPVSGLEEWQNPFQTAGDLRHYSIVSWRTLFLNLGMVHSVGTVGGFDGIRRSSAETLRKALSLVPQERAVALLRIFGVADLIGPVPLQVKSLEPIAPSGPRVGYVYRIPQPLPLAYLVSRIG